MHYLIGIVASLLLLITATPVSAQTYPERTIRLVVPFAAGGGGDAVARPLAQRLSEILGQQVVIDNRGGANGNIGAEEVARATPDGYTLLFANSSLPISATLYPKLSFDVLKDFVPVGLVSISASVMVVHPAVQARTVKELITLAKSQPGKFNFGSAGVGSTMHLAGELFKSMAGINMVHVPYRGAGPVISDLIGGHLQVVFINIPPVIGNVRANQVRALAVTTRTRSAVLPDVPTLDESGLAGFESTTWYGIMGPANLPAPIVTRLNQAIGQAVKSENLSKLLIGLGSNPSPRSPAEFAQFLRQDIDAWAKIIKVSGAKVD